MSAYRPCWRLLATGFMLLGTCPPILRAQRTSAPALSERLVKPIVVVDTWGAGEFFGRMNCIVALPGGGVAVFDAASSVGNQAFVFDGNGRMVKRLGRSGSGPGEYGSQNIDDCLTLTHDKDISLHDLAGGRLVVWKQTGQFVRELKLPVRLSGAPPYVVWQDDGHVLVKTQVRGSRPGVLFDPLAYAMLKVDVAARIRDTLRFAMPPDPVSASTQWFGPRNFSFVRSDGSRLLATSVAMKFSIVDTKGKVINRERPFMPVKPGAAERTELLAITAWNQVVSRGMMKDEGVATVKSAFSQVQIAPDGNIWIRASVPSVRGAPRRLFSGTEQPGEPQETFREPPVFEIFGPRGDHLARLRLADPGAIPLRFSMNGLTVWGVAEREDGSQLLVRWK